MSYRVEVRAIGYGGWNVATKPTGHEHARAIAGSFDRRLFDVRVVEAGGLPSHGKEVAGVTP